MFEKENINTLDMNGELLLTIMSSLAQQEVESLSQNVKMGLQRNKDISSLESKKSRMTDMLIDGTISKEVYEEKMVDFTRKLHKLSERKALLEDSICTQKDINRRMSELRDTLEKEQVLDEFDSVELCCASHFVCKNLKLPLDYTVTVWFKIR